MNIYLDTIGCRLNQAEIEHYARQFRAAGHILVATPEEADLAVVNTCAVTTQAVADSRQKVRQISRAGVDEIVLTGCWSTLRPEEATVLPGVTRVTPNAEKDDLVSQVLNLPPETFDLEPVERQPLPGARLRTRAFIKAQDGCDNRCTFCVTTLARGAGRSRPVAAILTDVRAALHEDSYQGNGAGAQEIVLTGVHLGSWGQDLEPHQHLGRLVQTILAETETPRLRLSSVEPWDLDGEFFSLWQDPRLCRHLHLPLQSGSATVLRRMARKTTPQAFAHLVDAARSVAPDMAITTDVITGFPGETEVEFQETVDFVRYIRFAGGHVFTYSVRPGTAAARMPDQVPHALRKERNARLRQVFSQAAGVYQAGFIGRVLPVLWESAAALGPDGWEMSGLTGNYLRVNAIAGQELWNHITPVRLERVSGDVMHGSIVS